VTHFSKGTSGKEPIDRITGSVAFGALARVVMVAAKEPEADDGTAGRRILARAKSNIGPDEGGFAYSLELKPMPGHDIEASVAVNTANTAKKLRWAVLTLPAFLMADLRMVGRARFERSCHHQGGCQVRRSR
jgi:hypothetical protein